MKAFELYQDLKYFNQHFSDKRIDAMMIKLASESSDEFLVWLKKNPQIRGLLKEPEVYDALLKLPLILPQLESFDRGALIKFVTIDRGRQLGGKIIPIYIVIGEMGGNVVSSLLGSHQNLTQMFKGLIPVGGSVSPSVIEGDLLTLSQRFQASQSKGLNQQFDDDMPQGKPKKQTKKDKTKTLFINMLGEATNNVKSAVQSAHDNGDLTSYLVREDIDYQSVIAALGRGVLSQPKELASIFPIMRTMSSIDKAKRIANTLRLGDGISELNFEVLKRELMTDANIREFKGIPRDPLEDYPFDISALVGVPESDESFPSPSSKFKVYETKYYQWLDSNVLSVLSYVLHFLFKTGW